MNFRNGCSIAICYNRQIIATSHCVADNGLLWFYLGRRSVSDWWRRRRFDGRNERLWGMVRCDCLIGFRVRAWSGGAIPFIRLIRPLFDIVSAAIVRAGYALGRWRAFVSALREERNHEQGKQFPWKENHRDDYDGNITDLQNIVLKIL